MEKSKNEEARSHSLQKNPKVKTSTFSVSTHSVCLGNKDVFTIFPKRITLVVFLRGTYIYKKTHQVIAGISLRLACNNLMIF